MTPESLVFGRWRSILIREVDHSLYVGLLSAAGQLFSFCACSPYVMIELGTSSFATRIVESESA